MELIKITEQDGKKVVSARDLHTFLESKKDFSSWIKHRINKYGLIRDQDYTVLPQTGELENQRLRIEYALTLDAAKELSMVEGNSKGKEARQYFIECEKVAKSGPALPTTKELALMVLRAEEEKEKLLLEKQILEAQTEEQENQLKIQAPKVEYCETVLASSSSYCPTDIAKHYGWSGKKLNKILCELNIQFPQGGTYVLYSHYSGKNYTTTRTIPHTKADGSQGTRLQTRWTEQGRAFLHQVLIKRGYIQQEAVA